MKPDSKDNAPMAVVAYVMAAVLGLAGLASGYYGLAPTSAYDVSLETAALFLTGCGMIFGLAMVARSLDAVSAALRPGRAFPDETTGAGKTAEPDGGSDAESDKPSETPTPAQGVGSGAAERKPAPKGDPGPDPDLDADHDALPQEEDTPPGQPETDDPEPGAGPQRQDHEELIYVVEDKTIRGCPARILSDGTLEARTGQGWLRFEDLDHLNEYLDAGGDGA